MAEEFHVNLQGLRDLRKDLKALGKEVNRELTGDLKEAIEPVAARARRLAPKDSGRLAASIKPYAAGVKVGVRSSLPYANPVHWGWRAHGIAPSLFVVRAVDDERDRIVDNLGDAIEGHARRHGWH